MEIKQLDAKTVEEIFTALNDLRTETKRCAEGLTDILAKGQWLDEAAFNEMTHALLMLHDKQNGIKELCQQNDIELGVDVAAMRSHIDRWVQERDEAFRRGQFMRILETVQNLIYTGPDPAVGLTLEKIKKDAASLMTASLTVESLAKAVQKYSLLLDAVKSGKKDLATIQKAAAGFPENLVPVTMMLMGEMLEVSKGAPVPVVSKTVEESVNVEEPEEPLPTPETEEKKEEKTEEVHTLPLPEGPFWTIDIETLPVMENPFPENMKTSKKFLSVLERKAGRNLSQLDKKILGAVLYQGMNYPRNLASKETTKRQDIEFEFNRLYEMGCLANFELNGEKVYFLTEGCKNAILSNKSLQNQLVFKEINDSVRLVPPMNRFRYCLDYLRSVLRSDESFKMLYKGIAFNSKKGALWNRHVTLIYQSGAEAEFEILLPLFEPTLIDAALETIRAHYEAMTAEERAAKWLVIMVFDRNEAKSWIEYGKRIGFKNIAVWESHADTSRVFVKDRDMTTMEFLQTLVGENSPTPPPAKKSVPKPEAQPEPKKMETPKPVEVEKRKEEAMTIPEKAAAPIFKEEKFDGNAMLSSAAQAFVSSRIPEGMLLLHGMEKRLSETWVKDLSNEIGYLVSDPLYHHREEGNDGFHFWKTMLEVPDTDTERFQGFLHTGSLLRGFFEANSKTYLVNTTWKQLNDAPDMEIVVEIPEIKQLMNLFRMFSQKTGVSLSEASIPQKEGRARIESIEKQILREIGEQADILKHAAHSEVNHLRVHGLLTKLFNEKNGEFSWYFQDIQSFKTKDLCEVCADFTDIPLAEVGDLSALDRDDLVSENRVKAYLDTAWYQVETKFRKTDKIIGVERIRISNIVKRAARVLIRYTICKVLLDKKQDGNQVSAGALNKAKDEAETLIALIVSRLSSMEPEKRLLDGMAREVLMVLLRGMNQQLKNQFGRDGFYDPLLRSKAIEFLPDGRPDTEFSFGLPEFDLFARAEAFLKEAPAEEESWKKVYEESLMRFNLGNCRTIAALYHSEINRKDDSEKITKNGIRFLDTSVENFRGEIELAYNYNRISQNQMEGYLELGDKIAMHLREMENYGMMQEFMKACQKRIEKESTPRRESLKKQLETLKEDLTRKAAPDGNKTIVEEWPIIRRIEECLAKNNLSAAEDFIRKCADEQIKDVQVSPLNDMQAFFTFLDQYDEYHKICFNNKGKELNSIYAALDAQKRGRRRRDNAQSRNEKEFVDAWSGMKNGQEKNIKAVLYNLSYDMDDADLEITRQTQNRVFAKVTWKDQRNGANRTAYRHPFAKFGSEAYKKGLQVVSFSGNHTPQNIVNELENANVNAALGTICFVDTYLGLAERRELARLCKTNTNMENVIVIDRVMALYLTQKERLNRGNEMLEIALPFASVQPFIEKWRIWPEMFMGRTRELRDIRRIDGPVFVYGGRQLGKSALLCQTCNLEHDPENGHYAYYWEVKDKDALSLITETLCGRDGLLKGQTVSSWDELEEALVERMKDPEVQKVMLLLDEADAFILESEAHNNKPIEVLNSIRNRSDMKFKFVLAGLHNLLRFDKKYLGGNTVFGQLTSMTIRPFTYSEASELIMKPLSYLGFQIKNPEILSVILAKTNYFPGLIQFYGRKLIETVSKSYGSGMFNNVNNPPYVLDDAYLKELLQDKDFSHSIEEKFLITLVLDKDNYYNIIALAMAYMYAEQGPGPVTLEEIRECCDAYDITKITSLTDTALAAYMDEMTDLNILRHESSGGYIFNRYSFYSMLGSTSKIEEELEKESAGGKNHE